MTLQIGRIFGLVLFKRKVANQEGIPAGQRQSGAGPRMRFLAQLRALRHSLRLIADLFYFYF